MDKRNNEKPEAPSEGGSVPTPRKEGGKKDQVNKPTKTKRTKHIIKLKQENNECFEIIIKKGNIILSLD